MFPNRTQITWMGAEMPDGVQRAMTRQIRCAWEIYAVKELGMSAGEALRAFDNWQDSLTEHTDGSTT